MKKHIHADLMLLYAQDAMETSEPWTRWEILVHDKWAVLTSNPTWHEALEYRRKPQTILVNGIEVPKPEARELELGTVYYIVDPSHDSFRFPMVWKGYETDVLYLERGLVHLTEEAAAAHGKAMTQYKEVEQ